MKRLLVVLFYLFISHLTTFAQAPSPKCDLDRQELLISRVLVNSIIVARMGTATFDQLIDGAMQALSDLKAECGDGTTSNFLETMVSTSGNRWTVYGVPDGEYKMSVLALDPDIEYTLEEGTSDGCQLGEQQHATIQLSAKQCDVLLVSVSGSRSDYSILKFERIQ